MLPWPIVDVLIQRLLCNEVLAVSCKFIECYTKNERQNGYLSASVAERSLSLEVVFVAGPNFEEDILPRAFSFPF